MWVTVEVWQVRLRTAISVYCTLLFFLKNVKKCLIYRNKVQIPRLGGRLSTADVLGGRCPSTVCSWSNASTLTELARNTIWLTLTRTTLELQSAGWKVNKRRSAGMGSYLVYRVSRKRLTVTSAVTSAVQCAPAFGRCRRRNVCLSPEPRVSGVAATPDEPRSASTRHTTATI